MRKALNGYYPAIAWGVVILVLSVSPTPNLPQTFAFEPDKAAHVFVYAVLAWLFFRAQKPAYKTSRIIWIVFACAAYGLLLEVIQKTFFPYRYFEWGDVIANTGGSILGWVIFSYIYGRKSF